MRVQHVHDGDTVQLDTGHKLRLIGIDTPELAREHQGEQAYARTARDRLRALLTASAQPLRLLRGVEAEDRYGRSLGHLFFDSGDSVQAALLDAGIAVAYTTPPDARYSVCYRAAETSAREAGRGLWSLPGYQPQSPAALVDDADGFHILRAEVINYNTSRSGQWLDLAGGVGVQIKTEDSANFDSRALAQLIGRLVEIRGWLHPRNSKHQGQRFYMQLRHADNLSTVGERLDAPPALKLTH